MPVAAIVPVFLTGEYIPALWRGHDCVGVHVSRAYWELVITNGWGSWTNSIGY